MQTSTEHAMAHIPPPWADQRQAAPLAEVLPRAPNGQFVPGTSGNAAGRPRGLIDRRNRVAKAFDQEFDAIGAALVEKAKAGDVQAMALYLSRVEPPLRPKGERTPFALDVTQPLAKCSAAVIQAVADGVLSGDEAQVVLSCLATHASIVAADELEARLARLEGAGGAHRTMGGVLEMKAS